MSESNQAKSFISDNLSLITERGITLAAGLVASIVIARHLGPEAFGIFNYVLAIALILRPLTRMGLAGILTREMVARPDSTNQILGSAFMIRLIIASLLVLLLLAGQAYWGWWEPLVASGVIAMVAIQIVAALQVCHFAFEAQGQYKSLAWSRSLAVLIGLVLKVWAVFTDQTVEVFIALLVIDVLLLTLLPSFVYSRFAEGISHWRPQKKEGQHLLSKSWWLVVSGVASILYLKIDQLMIEAFLGHENLGIYSVAVRLSEVWYAIAIVFATTLFPRLLRRVNKQAQKDLLASGFVMLCLVGFVITLFMLVVSTWLVPALFGEPYSGAIPVLMIQMIPLAFMFMRELASKCLIMDDLYPFSLLSHGLGLTVNVAVNLLLIPAYGMVGAAWGTVIAYVLASYICFIPFAKSRYLASHMTHALGIIFRPHRWFQEVQRFRECIQSN